ncbi:hypothetical protein BDR04DRAFT_1232655 [Suillus decipiens]|nr:hypothetical protein BDR04DRAFT_1232655 [Suillus decipiens]
MSGNNEFISSDIPDIIQVNVQSDTELATLYDTASQLYIGFNAEEKKVTGYTDPQMFNLIPSGDSYSALAIQQQNTEQVCYLQDDSEGSSISVGPKTEDDEHRWQFVLAY